LAVQHIGRAQHPTGVEPFLSRTLLFYNKNLTSASKKNPQQLAAFVGQNPAVTVKA
jgi:hypothetical protein